MPEGEIHIPTILPVLKTLDQVVDVDYYMPGCPPESHQIAAVIDLVIQVLQGKAQLPPKGTVIGAGNSTVCDECQRKRDVKSIKAFERIWAIAPEPSIVSAGAGHSRAMGLRPAAAATPAAPRRERSASAAMARQRASRTTGRD